MDAETDPDLLLLACERGHRAVVECLLEDAQLPLERPAAAAAKPMWSAMPLHVAARFGRDAVVRLLLEAHAKPGRADGLGITALHCASERGHSDVVEMLLDAGASPDQARENGTTPLYLAARDGHGAAVKLLLARGADAEACMLPVRDAAAGMTPLYAACSRGHTEVVTLLLEAGAAVDRANTTGTTALHVACHNGHAATAAALLHGRADADLAGGARGARPLLAAAERGHTACVELLVEAHADPTWRYRSGKTALETTLMVLVLSLIHI